MSFIIFPSLSSITLLPYFWDNSLLCVTIITSLSVDISFIKSIISILVLESSAPVGSSKVIILGLLTIARAIATLCFSPPDSSLGFL